MQLKDFDFRVWNKDEETLTYASKDYKLDIGFSNPQQDYGMCESELHAYYDGEPMCPSDCEIELWSGFYDKDGTKIYENDIITCYFAMNGQIVFEDAMFYVVDQNSGNKKLLYDVIQESRLERESILVEGNIHEQGDKDDE